MEIVQRDAALLNLFSCEVVEHNIKSLGRVLWLQLGDGPLYLANVLELIEMEVLKDGVFEFAPKLLVVNLGFKSKIKTKLYQSIVVELWDHLYHRSLPVGVFV
jgi:hypothetical protein